MTYSRRQFIKTAGLATAGTILATRTSLSSNSIWTMNSNTLKVGLIGCGGRGTGAAGEALNADPNVILTAMADAFEDHLESSYNNLKEKYGEKVQVPESNRFIGLDAYEKLLESDVDVVLLAAPPAFRPMHLEAAVNAKKHIFCEKPFAVDAPGLRRVMAAAKKAKANNLSLVSGFCWRYHQPKRDTFGRVLNGQIGNILGGEATYNTGELWFMERKRGWSDMEYKLRNWLYYNWLSGDHLVEQAIHSIDMFSWAMGDKAPLKISGTGGRQKRTDPKFGNVFDHFGLTYEYENGTKIYFFCRQQNNTTPSYAVELIGEDGRCYVDCRTGEHKITGKNAWNLADATKFTDAEAYKETEVRGMYQVEHDELFASIRANKPLNDGEWMTRSNMLALAGRMAAYSGQTITYDQAQNSSEIFFDDSLTLESKYDLSIAIPGITEFK
ncbi:Gfo/Idh/MocA family oxidoreductase [Lascolabacillus sp.]|jgi:myo-inositol 2-dehydrogenase/D-chiro-inositol 1-dehydrogenase|uniref:Gfo/Idh/MocA family protein n=1 Tax=Lascolabacillus sp. TaxID=1924068 RepID=UPI001B5C0BDD|nr:Gfo/Idh/MocA family oxidoreductase [Lascolabacillus sp.]MBP7105383.1 Gfo/Idh/MocA family oxidoreductase [Fermentimonas sp.]MDD2607649.1 Gfo/Idh/MocA family oxidoreductase [Lascolabacillus sp.]MDD4758867.1 Gfo/Idh/MocA family oxidoreductase [Lascolabacillus sp.]